jgi:DNA-directed RNA polymerase subunit RPC12/RpoP
VSKKPKIITLDIETSPIIAYVWGLFKQFVGLEQILQDWSVLSFGAKTLGVDGVRYHDVAKQKNFYDDRKIMRALWKELDQADIVITQNGIRFDHKKINARFLILGMPPPSPFKMVDTMVEAKKVAAFTSNKLAWLSRVLSEERKSDHGKFPGFLLWSECLKGNPEAWAEMREYNPQDVIATEEVYLKLRPWIEGHPNLAAYDDNEDMRCPNCSSEHVVRKGFRFTQTGKYARYKCGDCGAWSRGGYTENTLAKRKSLLRN